MVRQADRHGADPGVANEFTGVPVGPHALGRERLEPFRHGVSHRRQDGPNGPGACPGVASRAGKLAASCRPRPELDSGPGRNATTSPRSVSPWTRSTCRPRPWPGARAYEADVPVRFHRTDIFSAARPGIRRVFAYLRLNFGPRLWRFVVSQPPAGRSYAQRGSAPSELGGVTLVKCPVADLCDVSPAAPARPGERRVP